MVTAFDVPVSAPGVSGVGDEKTTLLAASLTITCTKSATPLEAVQRRLKFAEASMDCAADQLALETVGVGGVPRSAAVVKFKFTVCRPSCTVCIAMEYCTGEMMLPLG